MADSAYVWYSAAAGLVFLLVGFEEVPWRINVVRLARRVRARSTKKGLPHRTILAVLRRQTRWGGRVLTGFSMAAALFFANRFLGRNAPEWPTMLLAGTLVAGLAFLTFAFLVWAPRLFDAVESSLSGESATPNSHAPDAEGSHGPGA